MNSGASAQSGTNTYYVDNDGDGFGTDSYITSSSPAPPPGYAWRNGDCNDNDASINPYAPEIAGNDVDENCDGRLDEPTCFIYYDNDKDGYGDPATQISAPCDVDLGGTGFIHQGGDCNDNDRNINPGAVEICGNGIDDNCDGVIDNCSATYYLDNDGDGYGQTDSYITSTDAVPPAGYAANNGDCDDNSASVHPGAVEICDNGIDDDCDGVIDNCVYYYYFDNDGDGYGNAGNPLISYDPNTPPGYITQGGDCDDGDPSIHPGATEICGNRIDDNCDGQVDEECPEYTYYLDVDADGYGGDHSITISDPVPPEGYKTVGGDCNDNDNSIHPGATEICNGVDDNCDGVVDEGCLKEQLPDFTKTDIYGVTHHFYGDLAAGKAVVIEFSTGWCPFTQIAEPQIDNVYDDICQGQGNVKLYDIVFETEEQGFESDVAFGVKYANLHNVIYPIITNSKDVYNQFWYEYNITAIPTFLVVIPDANDPEKSTVKMIVGAIDNLKDSIENILANYGYTVTPSPALSISVSGSACNFPSPVTLTANVSSGIVWSTGETTQSINVTTEGDYFLNYSAGCGTITKKIHLEKPATGVLSSLSETACAKNGLITLNYEGGTPGAMLQYSTNGINWADFVPNFSGSRAFLDPYPVGTIYFRVHETISGSGDASSCEAYSNTVQILNEAMTNPELTITASRTDCSFPVTLTSPYAENNFWSTGETTQSITVNSPNTYYVINNDVCGDVANLIVVDAANSAWYRDADGDGYGDPNITQQACTQPSGYVQDNSDCNDADINSHPGAPEICDGVDNNCNGQIDEGYNRTTFYRDADGDGYGDASVSVNACSTPAGYVINQTDCDDADPTVHPGATEICDGKDNNCDGQVDEGITKTTYYRDADGDGYGNALVSVNACSKPAGYSISKTDCDDTKADVHPGATEICDGIDNNCDGRIDEGFTKSTYYRDADGDGYGNPAVFIKSCSMPAGYVANKKDCNDANAAINPLTKWYKDADNDGYYTGSAVTSCTSPGTGYKITGLLGGADCNDNDNTVYPNAPELCDGKDNNCNGTIDEGCGIATITIDDISKTEGNKGKANMTFNVTLSAASTKKITVQFATQNGTAIAGNDYAAKTGTLTFNTGVTKQTISISIIGDKTVESNETFKVNLNRPVNATIAKGTATGTIINDDGVALAATGNSIESITNYALKISPNPASNILHVELFGYTGNVTLQLMNLQGKIIKEKKLQTANAKYAQQKMDVSDIAGGIYVLAAVDEKGNRKTAKVIIAK